MQSDWQRDLDGLHQLQLREIASFAAPTTRTIGSVIVFGLNQLQAARATGPGDTTQTAGPNQPVNGVGNAMLGSVAGGGDHFSERWAASIAFQLGADEAENLLIAELERITHAHAPILP